MSKVAVIIINYNTYQKTKKCIDILREKINGGLSYLFVGQWFKK